MRNFTVHNECNQIVGTVSAIDGDTAWALATIANPKAHHLKPTG